MKDAAFSKELEEGYYSKNWPKEAVRYSHLEPYLRCWLDPEAVFKGKTVLDIGAGEATYTRLIADRFGPQDGKSTRLNSSQTVMSYPVFCLKKIKINVVDCIRTL